MEFSSSEISLRGLLLQKLFFTTDFNFNSELILKLISDFNFDFFLIVELLDEVGDSGKVFERFPGGFGSGVSFPLHKVKLTVLIILTIYNRLNLLD